MRVEVRFPGGKPLYLIKYKSLVTVVEIYVLLQIYVFVGLLSIIPYK